MSLAQEPGFKPKNTYRAKLSWDMPTRNLTATDRYTNVLKDRFYKSNKKEQKEIYELLTEAIRILMHNSWPNTKNRKKFTRDEQINFQKIAMKYQVLKEEFGREVL
jgi:hypothetical protein